MNNLNKVNADEREEIIDDTKDEYDKVYRDFKRDTEQAIDDKKTELDEARHQTEQLKEQLKELRAKLHDQEQKTKRHEYQVKRQEALLKNNHDERLRIAKATVKRKQAELDKLNKE